jgi:hypothetical protein
MPKWLHCGAAFIVVLLAVVIFVGVSAVLVQDTGINALSFVLHQVKHGVDHPRRGEDLPMVGDTLFGLDIVHMGRFISVMHS